MSCRQKAHIKWDQRTQRWYVGNWSYMAWHNVYHEAKAIATSINEANGK